MWARSRRFLRDTAGAALVEMSIVTPFLVILGFGIVEFGNALHQYHLITTGLRDAARYLARVDNPIAEQAKGKDLAVYGEIGGTTKRISWWNTTDVSVTLEETENDDGTGKKLYRGGDTIYVVRVSTNVNQQGFGLLSLLNITSPLKFFLFQEERHIGE